MKSKITTGISYPEALKRQVNLSNRHMTWFFQAVDPDGNILCFGCPVSSVVSGWFHDRSQLTSVSQKTSLSDGILLRPANLS